MKKFYPFLLLINLLNSVTYKAIAQCSGGSSFASVVAPANSGTSTTMSSCNWAGDYNTITNCVSGTVYVFTASPTAYITIRQSSPTGSVVGYGSAPVTIISPISGTLYMIINNNATCGTGTTCLTTTIVNAGNTMRRCVDSLNGNDANNGFTWATALKTLSRALKNANDTATINTILVAKGTYYPTGTQSGTNRDSTFLIPQRGGIKIYGGYANGGATRNTAAYPTILSGDIGTANDNSDNSYHVMAITGIAPTADSVVVDGFKIIQGNANTNSTNTINGQSTDRSKGGGIFNQGTSGYTKMALKYCNILNNNALNNGGGFYNESSASSSIANCAFSGNTAAYGGGIYNSSSSPTIVNSVFSGNTASTNAGGIANYNSSSAKFTNCTFWNNYAVSGGGAIDNNNATLTIANCIFNGNTASANPEIWQQGGSINLTYSYTQSTWAGTGNIVGNSNPFVNAANPAGIDGSFGTADDGLRLQAGSPCINAGTPDTTGLNLGNTDIAGYNRVKATRIDIGAYEFQKDFYYSKTNNAAAGTLSNWSITTDGTGAAPTSFIGNRFIVQSGHTLTNAASLNLDSSALFIQANAGINNTGTLSVGSTLSNNGSITGTGTVVLNGLMGIQYIDSTGTISNLTLNNANGASIAANGKLYITDTYTPTSGTLTTNSNLILQSAATGTARIAPGASAGGYINGTVRVQRYIPGGYRKYRFIGHPFNAAINLTQLTDSIDITGNITGSNANSFTATTSNAPSAFTFTEANGNGSANDAGWAAITSSSSVYTIAQGKGLRVLIRGSKGQAGSLTGGTYTPNPVTISWAGVPTQGNFTQSLSYTSSNTTYPGWNLVSNPYASNIDWTSVTRTNVDNAVYSYRPSLNGGTYATWVNGSSTNGGSNIIESGSAFFVHANNTSPSLGWHETDKLATVAPNTMFRNSNTINDRLGLTVEDDNTHSTDEVILRFGGDHATNLFDPLYDARNLPSSNSDLYALDALQNAYSIYHGTALETNPSGEKRAVRLGIDHLAAGTYSFKAIVLNSFSNGNIAYLKDELKDTLVEIQQTGTTFYRFVVDTSTTSLQNRFSIVFNAKQRSALATTVGPSIHISPNPASNNVTVTFSNDRQQPTAITLFDATGRKLKEIHAGNVQNGSITINISKLAKGTYYIALNGEKTQVLIKK